MKCECTLLNDVEDEQNESIDDDDDEKWVPYLKLMAQSQLYNLSGIERLKPPEKKIK